MATGDEYPDPHRPFALIGLAVTGVLAGAVFGTLTNSINGLVSPLYFSERLRLPVSLQYGTAADADSLPISKEGSMDLGTTPDLLSQLLAKPSRNWGQPAQ